NAKRLTKKELREFASSAQLVMMNHHYSDPARSFSDRMKGKKLGDKRVVIYDEYQKVDYFIADHKLSDIEKQVADISYEEARWIPLKPFYGEKQIPASRVTIGRSYPKDNSTYSESVLTAEDPRTILEIWQQIQEPLEAFAKERLDGNSDLKEIGIKLVRHVKDFLTPEQREFAKNAPGGDDVKWFKKYVTEQGLEVTNATTIIVSPHVGSAYDADIREEVIDLLEKHLPKYKKDKAYISCSLGGYVDELKAETTYDFVWDAELYVGESIDIDRYYFVNQAREAQRLEERMRRFGKK
ncbi:hypothetical protein KY315_03385, partial [Candidatus Woesearchaeota archaeon]|nr:hypothetical protein [Candidatus Woesearchaeota archaeon]